MCSTSGISKWGRPGKRVVLRLMSRVVTVTGLERRGKLGDPLSYRLRIHMSVLSYSTVSSYSYNIIPIMDGVTPSKDTSSLSKSFSHLPILNLSHASDPKLRPALLTQLHSALFNIGFLYIINHGVPTSTIKALTSKLPALFDLPQEVKASLSKLNSPHFLGYSGFAEETTLGQRDLREQFDLASELSVVWREDGRTECRGKNQKTSRRGEGRDMSKLYWRLRGPNQWPPEVLVPGFREAFTKSASSTAMTCSSRPVAQFRR